MRKPNGVDTEPDWVPYKLAQKEDRAHRLGQVNCVDCYYLVLEDSLDAHMLKAAVHKLEVTEQVLDSDALQGPKPPLRPPGFTPNE